MVMTIHEKCTNSVAVKSCKTLFFTVFKWGQSLFLMCVFLNSSCSLHKPSVETIRNNSGQVIIDYQREGGILPLTEKWRFFSDGELRGADEKTYRLDKQASLLLLKSCQGIENNYSPPSGGTCRDCYTVTLELNCDGRKKTVSVHEGLPGTPLPIAELLTTIRRALSTRKPVR